MSAAVASSSSGLMRSGAPVSDGSWTLTVFVTDLQVERNLRVRGDLHIGGVMIRLVDELGKAGEKARKIDTTIGRGTSVVVGSLPSFSLIGEVRM